MKKEEAHQQLMTSVSLILTSVNDKKDFAPFIQALEKGKDEGRFYNTAVRRLCTSPSEKVIPILACIFKYRLVLNISFTEKNEQGFSALDYAAKKNKKACEFLHKCIEDEYKNLITQGATGLLNGLAEREIPPFHEVYNHPQEVNSLLSVFKGDLDPNLSDTQEEAIAEGAKKSSTYLAKVLKDPELLNKTSDPAKKYEFCQQVTKGLINSLGVALPNKTVYPEESLIQRLQTIAGKDKEKETTFFIELCQNGLNENEEKIRQLYFEKAIRLAIYFPDQKIAAEMIEALVNTSSLAIDLNAMNQNQEGQTPLHETAIQSNWPLYYVLVGAGAHSSLPDKSGNTPQLYRLEKQGKAMGRGENPFNFAFAGLPPINSSAFLEEENSYKFQ